MKNTLKSLTLTPDEIGFLFVAVTAVLLHSVKISEFVASFLALPSLLVIPCLFGESILTILRLLSRIRLFKSLSNCFSSIVPLDMTSFYTISWMLGSHALANALLVLTLLRLPTIVKNFAVIVLIVIAVNLIYKRYKGHRNYGNNFRKQFKNNIKFYLALSVVIAIAFIGIGISKMFFPFPSIVGRTYFLLPWQVQYAYRIVESGYFVGGRWPDPLFTALALSLFDVQPLNFLWSAPFLLAATYAYGVFILSYKMSKSLGIAIISGLFSVFVLSSGPIRPGFFITLNSNTVMQSIFPIVLYTIYQKMTSNKYHRKNVIRSLVLLALSLFGTFLIVKKIYLSDYTAEGTLFFESTLIPMWMIVIPLVGIFLSILLKDKSSRGLFVLVFMCSTIFFFMHMDEALLYTLAMLLFVAFYQLAKERIGRLLILAVAVFAFAFISLQWSNILNIFYSPNFITSIWSQEITPTEPVDMFDIKKTDFEFGYRNVAQYLVILGCIFGLTSEKEGDKIMTGMFSMLLLLFFLPEYQTIRTDSQLFPFMAYILSIAFISIQRKTVPFNKRSYLNKIASSLMTVLMLAAMVPSLVVPIYEISFKLSSPRDPYSYCSIAEYEYEAGDWIKTGLPETTIIISDYRTMLILNSLGNKNWLLGKGMSGTATNLMSEQALEKIKYDVFKANKSEEAYSNIMKLPAFMDIKERRYLEYAGMEKENVTFIVVLSSRTVKWIEQKSLGDIVHAQYSDVPSEYLRLFNDTKYFELIHQTNTYSYVYKLKAIAI